MSCNYFEKPKDWGVAPSSSWVSGSPVNPDQIKMPDLGSPASHEEASSKISFGDDEGGGGGLGQMSLFQGHMVKQCPPGTSSQKGVCLPDTESQASPEEKMKTYTQNGRQWEHGGKEGKGQVKEANSFKRDMPKAAREADPQIKRLAKLGVKGRHGV
jgi:hypothetical protein